MEEPKYLNSSLKDIWNTFADKDKHHSYEETKFSMKESIDDILTSYRNFTNDGQISYVNNNNLYPLKTSGCLLEDSPDKSRLNWQSPLDILSMSSSNSNEKPNSPNQNFIETNPQHFDIQKLLNFHKSDNISRETRRFKSETDTMDILTANLSNGISDKILNTILENFIASSNQKDFFAKSNVIKTINNILQKPLTKNQYQRVQNAVLTIYGKSNSYYQDPLQGFYNQELLMLLLKNQTPNPQHQRLSEPIHSPEPAKPSHISVNANPISLKDEIAVLSMSYRNMMGILESDIEKAATLYRTSATAMAQKNEAAYQWTGKLPITSYKVCQYSRKVFLGGVPWDSTENDLMSAFIKFGYLSVMFPQKDLNGCSKFSASSNSLKGYCYIIFESEDSVARLLSQCNKNEANGGEFFKISSPKFRSKDVQVIPWITQDSQYCRVGSQKPDSKKTVFVGALHGMMTAYALANVMNELFDNVIFTALDTDKYKYPIGSGRVTFSSQKSYMRAVTANFIHVKTAKFSKTIQIDPYLEDSMCNNCFQSPGIYFCRSFECFRYFCSGCWQVWHNRCETLFNHKPLRRTFKPIFDFQ